MLGDVHALHCLQLGGTQYGMDLLTARGLVHRIHVTGDGCDGLCAEPTQLPLATSSVDLVVLAHALEFHPTPHQLLREVDRVLKLDGHVLAIGFNPWSLFGVRRVLAEHWIPWSGHFYGARRVADWCAVLGIHPRARASVLFKPPVHRQWLRRGLQPLEALGQLTTRGGGVYLLLACKYSLPLTPSPALSWQWPTWAPPPLGVRPRPAPQSVHSARHATAAPEREPRAGRPH
jgi:SAM-dependent methyltransferase